jgi:hypothetical protein
LGNKLPNQPENTLMMIEGFIAPLAERRNIFAVNA